MLSFVFFVFFYKMTTPTPIIEKLRPLHDLNIYFALASTGSRPAPKNPPFGTNFRYILVPNIANLGLIFLKTALTCTKCDA